MEKLSEGTVLAAGAGGFDKDGKRIPMDVKPGDKVILMFLGVCVDDVGSFARVWWK